MPGKLKMHVSLGWMGDDRYDEINLPDDWADMPKGKRDAWCAEALDQHIDEHIESSYEVVEDKL